MVAFNFMECFEADISAGLKRQTIRQREHGRRPRCNVDDAMQLYVRQRTKSCRKIADAVCTKVVEVYLTDEFLYVDGMLVLGEERFAQADGFPSKIEFRKFFRDKYGLPFLGYLYGWNLVAVIPKVPAE